MPIKIFFVAICALFQSHEFYVGLADVEYNPKSKTYQVALKIFSDDLEKGVKTSGRIDSGESEKQLFNYLLEHFKMYRENGSLVNLSEIGMETEYDVTWIYLESEKIQPLEEITVFNDILMEIYDDQTHIINIKQGELTLSGIVHRKEKRLTFHFDD